MFTIDNIAFMSPFDLDQVEDSTKAPVLIDLAPTLEVRDFLKKSDRFTYVDHHVPSSPDSAREQEVYDNFVEISDLANSHWNWVLKAIVPFFPSMGKEVRVNMRENAPSCTRLIKSGEFVGRTIYSHNDPDGLLSAMKALGITYPEMDQDADVLDGARSGQTEETLSEYGWLLKRAIASVPPYNPKRSDESAKEKVFSAFIQLVRDGSETARTELEEMAESYETSVKEAGKLSQQAIEVSSGVWLVDVRDSKKFELGVLSNSLENKGAIVTVILKGFGPIASEFGEQYSIAVKRGEKLNLQKLHSESETNPEMGLISNVPFILHCNTQWWNDLKGALSSMVQEYLDNKVFDEIEGD